MTNSELIERRDRLMGVGAPIFYNNPIHLVRGEGVWLFDADDRRYLDLYNNVPCVGHCHPHVVQAMKEQAETLNVHNRYLHAGVLDYAQRLVDCHADSLTSAIFTCSGTEANEVAMSMARIATGGRGFICSDAAYHGNSSEVSKLTRVGSSGLSDPEIRSIPFPQCYRPIRKDVPESELTGLYLAAVQDAIDGFKSDAVSLAGVMFCPILANEGLPNIPDGFMQQAAELVRSAGGLFIADEVQAGFCRTGCWWGYEMMDFVPDIVTMGKPMGNGLPLAGVVASTELVNAFREGKRYFNTFASSPLQAAVGSAVMDVIETENLRQSVSQVGEYITDELAKMQDSCEAMGDVRSQGLFIAMEWVRDRQARTPDPDNADRMVNGLKEKGFLIGCAGVHRNVLKIRPPLVLQREHADLFLTAFEETLGDF